MSFENMPASIALHYLLTDNYVMEDEKEVWAIGDVHGCATQFDELCRLIKSQARNGAIIFQLGDLLDRGPYLYKTIEVCKKYDVKCTIGNHELNFIQEHFEYKKCRSGARRKTHEKFNNYKQEYKDEIINFLLEMKNSYFVDIKGELWTLSHSPIRKQYGTCSSANIFCMNNVPAKEETWHNIKSVHGHQHWNYIDIEEQLNMSLNNLNLDGGCVYGGDLVGYCLSDNRFLKVKGFQYATH